MSDTATVTELPTTDDTPDSFELLNSGRVRFVMDGRTYTLRAPRLGEMRDFRDRLASLLDAKPTKKDPMQADGLLDLLVWSFETLGDKRLPDDTDALPGWVIDTSLPMQMLTHWRSAPLASGAK